jgi:hypothetical protein
MGMILVPKCASAQPRSYEPGYRPVITKGGENAGVGRGPVTFKTISLAGNRPGVEQAAKMAN